MIPLLSGLAVLHTSTQFSHFSAAAPMFLLMRTFYFPFPLSLFSLMAGCPGDSDSWPCLHQVRCISFYFVFHHLWLHKILLVSGDCCQKLQSLLLVGSLACFPSNPIIHLPTDRHLMKRISVVPGMVLHRPLPLGVSIPHLKLGWI